MRKMKILSLYNDVLRRIYIGNNLSLSFCIEDVIIYVKIAHYCSDSYP